MPATLSAKKEKFAQLMACGDPKTGKPLSQSEAYRLAFKPKKMKEKTVWEEASRVAADPKVSARIQELLAETIAKVTMTREEWLLEMEKIMRGDVRKMFSGPGDALPVSELEDNEAAMIEGFELVENFEKVGDKAEHVGYTKKYRLTPKLKRALEFGKVMGWYTEKKELELGATLEELVLGSMKK